MYSDNFIERNAPILIKNMNSSTDTTDWVQCASTYGVYTANYSPYLEVDHCYYMRFSYKFTTTDQSPTWAAFYFKGGGVAGPRISSPTAGVEYTASAIRYQSISNSYGGTVSGISGGTVYNGNSSAISGVTPYVKQVLVYDITTLKSALRDIDISTDDQIKTWCDTYLPYVKYGVNFMVSIDSTEPSYVGSALTAVTPFHLGKEKIVLTNLVTSLSAGGRTSVSGNVVTCTPTADTYFYTNLSTGLVLDDKYYVKAKTGTMPSGSVFTFGVTSQLNTPVWTAVSDSYSSQIIKPYSNQGGVTKTIWDDVNRTGLSESTVTITDFMFVDLTASGLLDYLALIGITTDAQIKTWCDTYIPYFTGEFEIGGSVFETISKSGLSFTIRGASGGVVKENDTYRWTAAGSDSYIDMYPTTLCPLRTIHLYSRVEVSSYTSGVLNHQNSASYGITGAGVYSYCGSDGYSYWTDSGRILLDDKPEGTLAVTISATDIMFLDLGQQGLYAFLSLLGFSTYSEMKSWLDTYLPFFTGTRSLTTLLPASAIKVINDSTYTDRISIKSGAITATNLVESDGMYKYGLHTYSYTDPYFDTTIQPSIYNNQGNGTVTYSRVDANEQLSPFRDKHKYVLRVITAGTASPYAGGIVVTHLANEDNDRYIESIVAKIPVGYNLTSHYNTQGTGASVYPLSSMKGTGKWEEYKVMYDCGTGTFSTGGHLSLSGYGTGKNVLPWQINSLYWTVENYQSRTTSILRNGNMIRFDAVSGNTSDTAQRFYTSSALTLSANTKYTISFDVRSNYITTFSPRSTTNGINFINGSTYCNISSAINFSADSEWHRVSSTITTSSATSYTINIGIDENLIGTGKFLEIKDLMISTSTDTTYTAYDSNDKVVWYIAYANSCKIKDKEYLKYFSPLSSINRFKSANLYVRKLDETNLLTNGDFYYSDLSSVCWNSSWYFDYDDYAGNSTCSLVQPVNSGAGGLNFKVQVDPSQRYKLSYWVKCKGDMTYFLTAIRVFVGSGPTEITHAYTAYKSGTKTTLASTLNTNDTSMTLTSASNWSAYSYSRLGFRTNNYYSWNNLGISNGYNSSTGLIKSVSGNVVTFNTAYTGSTMASGTTVVESYDGGTYPYPIVKGSLPTDNTWKYVEGYFGSNQLWDGSGGGWSGLPYDTKYILVYLNIYTNSGSVPIKYSDVRIERVTGSGTRTNHTVSMPKGDKANGYTW